MNDYYNCLFGQINFNFFLLGDVCTMNVFDVKVTQFVIGENQVQCNLVIIDIYIS